ARATSGQRKVTASAAAQSDASQGIAMANQSADVSPNRESVIQTRHAAVRAKGNARMRGVRVRAAGSWAATRCGDDQRYQTSQRTRNTTHTALSAIAIARYHPSLSA